MKIAIIGSGIAGMTAAYLLNRKHDVSLFEANGYIGGHTNTFMLKENDRSLAVDTGFIVFNEQNYPQLCRLFDQLNVDSRISDMSFSVHCEKTGLEYNGNSLTKIFAQRRNLFKPRFWGMLKDILRFNKDAIRALEKGLDDSTTVGQFTERMGYSDTFVEHYLVPLGASLWSCPASRFREFPMSFVIEFLNNHSMLQVDDRPVWRTVQGGSQQYVKQLTRTYADRIFLNTPASKVLRKKTGVEIHFGDGKCFECDEVIIASHANQTLALLDEVDDDERDLLGHFQYQQNEVVLHTDTGLLPKLESAWASWNYRIPAEQQHRGTVSYNMNMLQGLESEKTYCVSLNQTKQIDPDQIIYKVTYQHPQFSPGRKEVQSRHAEMIRRRGISCCGAYWGYGFHEDGVRSALDVCAAFNEELS